MRPSPRIRIWAKGSSSGTVTSARRAPAHRTMPGIAVSFGPRYDPCSENTGSTGAPRWSTRKSRGCWATPDGRARDLVDVSNVAGNRVENLLGKVLHDGVADLIRRGLD